jgi:hypothetical protein
MSEHATDALLSVIIAGVRGNPRLASELATALLASPDTREAVRSALTLALADPAIATDIAGRLGEREDGWLDVRRAARYLGISAARLHHLVADRDLVRHQSSEGAKLWFLKSELDAYRRGDGNNE